MDIQTKIDDNDIDDGDDHDDDIKTGREMRSKSLRERNKTRQR